MKSRIMALLCILLLAAAGCAGEQASSSTTQLHQGQGVLPGVVGNVGGSPGVPVAVEVPLTVDEQAPLGLDDTYTPGIVGGDSEFEEFPRTTSTVVQGIPPSGFAVVDCVMMPDGVAPNWNLAEGQFYEGDKVDMWIWYELYSPSMSLARRWQALDIGLDYPQAATSHVKGIYKVKLDYAIPFVGARNDAVFKFDVTGAGLNKVSQPFVYDILVKPGTSTAIYPESSDGDSSVAGYGAGWAQLTIEDLVSDSDYDFNDFVARMKATEYRNSAGDLVQIAMTVKAIARGAGYDAQWQFNFGAAFPGATAFARVDQYYANDTRHGSQVIWQSTNGLAIPIFAPTKGALPPPPGSFATNTVAGTKYVDGDYAVVNIFFSQPVAAGTYSPMPYEPELRVMPPGGPVYIVTYSYLTENGWHLGTTPNDGSTTPLGFIVPDTWAWPLEYQGVWNPYPSFLPWSTWVLAPNSGNQNDPNTYLVSPTPLIAGSQVGSTPQLRTYWTGSTGQDVFHHSAPAGQPNTTALLKYLNGDTTVVTSSVKNTSAAVGTVSLNMFKANKSYFTSGLPLSTTNINNSTNTSTGYTTLKSYITGATSTKPIEYQLGAELATLVLNVERGKVRGDEWVWIPEFGEIRAIEGDPRITTKDSVIKGANDAFALPTSTTNDALKTKWFNVCKRINANTYFVKNQPKAEPTPLWYNQAPTGTTYFKRSLFTN